MDERLPAGQRWIEDPVVYVIAAVMPLDSKDYSLRVSGLVQSPNLLSWQRLLDLPCSRIVRDFHCVTTWSVKDVVWEGVRTQHLLDVVSSDPDVRWVIAHGRDGYVTNVPFEHFSHPDSLLAYRMSDGPLSLEHGQPLRLVIPSLYAWKSAKHVNHLEFVSSLRRGFWEQRGYHDRGDPWKQERFRT
ncbi:molybdopterin-dependent oxidoreductase [Candidatus Bipolaricaulota bacterium]